MKEIPEFAIRRILVALDASAHSLAALEEAAAMAAAMEAELVGLFVEDINLLRLAGLPFTRQICYPSGTEEPLSAERMDRELKARAAMARQALSAAAERRQRPWSFQTARGLVAAEILTAAQTADLILAGKSGWSSARRMGSTALTLLAASPVAFLLVQQEAPQSAPVMIFYDGSEDSRRALMTAVRLALSRQVELVVFLSSVSTEVGDRLQQQALQEIGSRPVQFRFRRSDSGNLPGFAAAVRSEGNGLLLLPGSNLLAQQAPIRQLLELINNPVLVIR